MQPAEELIEVRDLDGTRKPARLLTCSNCGANCWICFVVEGQEHSHFQCMYCDVTYCPDGHCGKEHGLPSAALPAPFEVLAKKGM
jgi:hypothetical protein